MAAAAQVPERRRVRMVAWSSAWLIMLLAPADEIAQGLDHPAALAAALLVAFVALYLTLLWLSSDPTGGLAVRLFLLAPLTAMAWRAA